MSVLVQQSEEWLQMRKSKIGASDAPIIMDVSPWKTKHQLWQEKVCTTVPTEKTRSMQRGLDLEEKARKLFISKTGIEVKPDVIFSNEYNWMMASLDGIDVTKSHIVEIKCPNAKDHALALEGKVPKHYYPQLQHQMKVCEVDKMFYFSFDGHNGATVEVLRDPYYLENLIEEEKKFYECMLTKQPPELTKKDYKERNDELWQEYASKWISISKTIKDLEKEEEEIRKQLIHMSGGLNSMGAGIQLIQIQRKGSVDYAAIPQMKNVDLEMFRKPLITMWRICTE